MNFADIRVRHIPRYGDDIAARPAIPTSAHLYFRHFSNKRDVRWARNTIARLIFDAICRERPSRRQQMLMTNLSSMLLRHIENLSETARDRKNSEKIASRQRSSRIRVESNLDSARTRQYSFRAEASNLRGQMRASGR